MTTHKFEKILIPSASIDSGMDSYDDIDTGDIDGSGEIVVRAVDAAESEHGVEFYNVTVELDGEYERMTESDARAEAVMMLERDYCEDR